MKKYLFLLLLPFLLLGADRKADLGKESKIDSILASVNGEPITLLDVILESGREEARLAAMFTGERLYSETAEVRRRYVEEIVIRKLIYAKYKEKPFDIPKQHVEDMVDFLASGMGDGTRQGLLRKLRSMGSSLEELQEKALEKIAVEVLLMNHCDRRVSVTPRDIFNEYKRTPEKWTVPATLDLQLILLRHDRENFQELVGKLSEMLKGANEATFTLLAKENSEGPAAAKGGFVGKIEADKLRPEFAAVLLPDPVKNTIAGPVETPEGVYFLRIHDFTPARKLPFEKISPEIAKKLRSDALTKVRNEYKAQLLKEAVVRYFF